MRLIDADDLGVGRCSKDVLPAAYCAGWNGLLGLIEKAPTVDAVPVVHGRWEMRPTGMATDTGPEYKAYCTVCNEPNKQYQPPFCPHCGAKMDGGADHDE